MTPKLDKSVPCLVSLKMITLWNKDTQSRLGDWQVLWRAGAVCSVKYGGQGRPFQVVRLSKGRQEVRSLVGRGWVGWIGRWGLTYIPYRIHKIELVGSCCIAGAQLSAPWWPRGLGGRGQEIQKGEERIHIADSLCYIAETNTALWSNCTLIITMKSKRTK